MKNTNTQSKDEIVVLLNNVIDALIAAEPYMAIREAYYEASRIRANICRIDEDDS